ncbi:hypothetical protein JCGZ_05088 [Jatropha curcas]|uniref:Uncharacterized protein n=1 Tax=Jatropha curcas TaxID=180498 RepID=A0A067J9Q7_JATCU|nr:hypothetical protein JCGZ_05088 [Jatropha curcas]
MLEISLGLRIRDQFGLNLPYLTRNSFDSSFATAIHGSSVTRASSLELMGENIKQVMRSQLSPSVVHETVVNGMDFAGIAVASPRGRGDCVHATGGPIKAREVWKTDKRLQGSQSLPPLRRMVVGSRLREEERHWLAHAEEEKKKKNKGKRWVLEFSRPF